MVQRDSEILSVLQSLPSLSRTSSSSDSEHSPPQQSVNALQDNTQLEILKLLREIQMEMKRTNTQQKRPNQPQNVQYQKTPDDQVEPKRWVKKHYCWTHGASNHKSKNCRTKAQGHQDLATFEDKMGGSKAYCS